MDEVIEETSSEEDQQAQGYVAATGIFSPALDPRALPRSIGLSFTLEAEDGDPTIEICATWARYHPNPDHHWQREPACHLSGKVNASQDQQSFYPEPDVRLQVRSRPVSGGYRVSIFLVNERQIADDQRPQTWDYLFQPQIRVHLGAHTRLVPVMAGGADMPGGALETEIAEEQSLAMQYRKRTALARGHMCAAIWREIDPEQPLAGMEHPREAPYSWTDANSAPEAERNRFSPADVRTELIPLAASAHLASARPSRPGYFTLSYPTQQNRADADFEICCTNPECELNQHAWAEQVPEPREKTGSRKQNVRQAMLSGWSHEFTPGLPQLAGNNWQTVPEPFQEGSHTDRSSAIPIPAFTVDDQVYARCPSLVVATVDKFARLAFEGEAATLFGNVTHYHSRFGYYREACPPDHPQTATGNASEGFFRHPAQENLRREIPPFDPPDLILQGELHLIEGPLGSMVGIYETAVDYLCQRQVGGQAVRPKYIASTATARRAEPQVQGLKTASCTPKWLSRTGDWLWWGHRTFRGMG